MKRVLIIGGGFGGCTAIHLFKKGDWEVTLAEPTKDGLGGGVRTRFKSGHPYTYGPRHFLTHNEKVFEYLSSHLNMRLCKEHQFLSFVDKDSEFYNYPIHYDDIAKMPESEKIKVEINELEEGFKNASYKLTSGNTESQSKATDYEDFWKKSVGKYFIRKIH